MRGWAPLWACLALAAGCAGTPRAPAPAPDPALRWAEQVRERIAAAKESPSFSVRYNPTACDCPPFEIALSGRWHRVAFVEADAEVEDPVMEALDAAIARARARGAAEVWQLQGTLEETLSTCGRGAIVVGFEAAAFGAPAPAPGLEEE